MSNTFLVVTIWISCAIHRTSNLLLQLLGDPINNVDQSIRTDGETNQVERYAVFIIYCLYGVSRFIEIYRYILFPLTPVPLFKIYSSMETMLGCCEIKNSANSF